MKLVKHHTDEGQKMALIVHEGRKWMRVLYIGNTRLKRLPMTEQRYFRSVTEATKKQVAQFNRIARKFGATKRLAK